MAHLKLKRFVRAFLAITCISIYFFCSTLQYDKYLRNPNLKCNYTLDEQQRLLKLAHEVHVILNDLGLVHWLMYGSIYGALRYERPLPWDYDVDYGIYGEKFTEEKKSLIFSRLNEENIMYTNHLSQSGVIWCSKDGAKVDIFLFYQHSDGMMKRTGWEPWLLFLQYRYWHSFPAALVKPPLKKTPFGFFQVPIPHGGVEITRYLYRNDWWKIVKPLRCK